jgi:hypothetical protein
MTKEILEEMGECNGEAYEKDAVTSDAVAILCI